MSAIKLGKAIDKNKFNYIMMAAGFIAIAVLKIHPILTIIGCAIAGLVYVRGGKQNDRSA